MWKYVLLFHLGYLTWGNLGLSCISYAKNLYLGLEKSHDLYVTRWLCFEFRV